MPRKKDSKSINKDKRKDNRKWKGSKKEGSKSNKENNSYKKKDNYSSIEIRIIKRLIFVEFYLTTARA